MTANRYHGARARRYEMARRNQGKWKFEKHNFKRVLKLLGDEVENVIDAPIGTGMFLEFYNTPVRGYDISQDMLDMAALKESGAVLKVLDIVKKPIYAKASLVVCIRFLNLVSWKDATMTLKHLLAASKKYILFTMRTVPVGFKGAMNVGRVFLHKNSDLMDLLKEKGFYVTGRYSHLDTVPGSFDMILAKRIDAE